MLWNWYFHKQIEKLTLDAFSMYSINSISQKHIGTYYVQIEQENDFNVVRRILGNMGENIKLIVYQQSSFKEHHLKIRLMGKGSGFKNRYTEIEFDDSLRICVSSTNNIVFDRACVLLESLLRKIYDDFEVYLRTNNKRLECPKDFKMSYKSINYS